MKIVGYKKAEFSKIFANGIKGNNLKKIQLTKIWMGVISLESIAKNYWSGLSLDACLSLRLWLLLRILTAAATAEAGVLAVKHSSVHTRTHTTV